MITVPGVSGVTGVILAGLVFISFLGALVFLLLYVKVSRWRSSALGWHTFWLSVILMVLCGLAVIGIFLPDLPGRTAIRLASWSAFAFILWQRVWLLLKAFQEGPAGRHRAAVQANEEESERLLREEED